jgi:hypothetical protein
MGLIGDCGVATPRSPDSDLVGDNGLPPFVDVNMPHDLLARLVDPGERLDRRAALRLSFILSRSMLIREPLLRAIGAIGAIGMGPISLPSRRPRPLNI